MASILQIVGILIALIAVADRLLLGRHVDRWIKQRLLCHAFFRLADMYSFVAFGRWVARSFVAIATFMGLPGPQGWASLVLLTFVVNSLFFWGYATLPYLNFVIRTSWISPYS